MLDRVTITGADDMVPYEALLELSAEFPFVEWAILQSPQLSGARYPSQTWLRGFQYAFLEQPLAKCALHLCGRYARELLLGNVVFEAWITNGFDRIQLNFNADITECDVEKLKQRLSEFGEREWIFQIGPNGNKHFNLLHRLHWTGPYLPLFDASGGTGMLPKAWPSIDQYEEDERGIWGLYDDQENWLYFGYAGGLSPDNLAEQLPLMLAGPINECGKRSRAPRWIDVESGVRTNNQFDLAKVRQFLEISKPFVVESDICSICGGRFPKGDSCCK